MKRMLKGLDEVEKKYRKDAKTIEEIFEKAKKILTGDDKSENKITIKGLMKMFKTIKKTDDVWTARVTDGSSIIAGNYVIEVLKSDVLSIAAVIPREE